MNITNEVAAISALPADGRRDYLQELIGPPTADRALLHDRALLITALNDKGIWPVRARCSTEDDGA